MTNSLDCVVSIIIPCYNHGRFLGDAINSILNIKTNYSYEIIVVNDGSTDEHTNQVIDNLNSDRVSVIQQKNQGLAAARNNAIIQSHGKYILPLDADNKLHDNYLIKAIDILEQNPNVDIVYGDCMLFGEQNGLRKQLEMSFEYFLKIGNHIDACAVYRKKVWDKNNGYDGKMPAMGHEDWEFWVHSKLNGFKFYYLEELCFYYRTSSSSMNIAISTPSIEKNRDYIFDKHAVKIIKNILETLYLYKWKLDYIKNNKVKAIIKILLGYEI